MTASDVAARRAAQPPAAPVETSAPTFQAPQNTAERPPSSDAAEAGADTRCSAEQPKDEQTCHDCGAREPCDEDCPNHVEPDPVQSCSAGTAKALDDLEIFIGEVDGSEAAEGGTIDGTEAIEALNALRAAFTQPQPSAGCGDPGCTDPNCDYGKGPLRCQSCGAPIVDEPQAVQVSSAGTAEAYDAEQYEGLPLPLEVEITGPYKGPGDSHPCFVLRSDYRVFAAVYVIDGDEDRARREAELIQDVMRMGRAGLDRLHYAYGAQPQALQVTDAMCEAAIKADLEDRIQGCSYKDRHVIYDTWLPAPSQDIWTSPVGSAEDYQAFQEQCKIERMRKVLEAAYAVSRPQRDGGS
jgi:hypothetical protein